MRTIVSNLVIATGVTLFSVSLHAATLTSLAGKGTITDGDGNVKPLVENQAFVKGDRILVTEGEITIDCGEGLTLKIDESVKILDKNTCSTPTNLATGATVAATATATTTTGAAITSSLPFAKIAVIAAGLGTVVAVARDDDPASP